LTEEASEQSGKEEKKDEKPAVATKEEKKDEKPADKK